MTCGLLHQFSAICYSFYSYKFVRKLENNKKNFQETEFLYSKYLITLEYFDDVSMNIYNNHSVLFTL